MKTYEIIDLCSIPDDFFSDKTPGELIAYVRQHNLVKGTFKAASNVSALQELWGEISVEGPRAAGAMSDTSVVYATAYSGESFEWRADGRKTYY